MDCDRFANANKLACGGYAKSIVFGVIFYMKKIFAAIALTFVAVSPATAQTYMGKASTGEAVYYNGAKGIYCGAVASEKCWRYPETFYRIGSDNVTAIVDCKVGVFKEVRTGSNLVTRNMKPQSDAIQKILNKACDWSAYVNSQRSK